MKIDLPVPNSKASIFVHHFQEEPPKNPWESGRGTRVSVVLQVGIGNEETFVAESRCSAKDQFARAKGRKVAAERVLAQMSQKGFNTLIKREIFKAICPEFFKPKKEKGAAAPAQA